MPLKHPRPLVVVSRCLGFAACRWNGDIVNDPFVERLGRWVEYRPVCPEEEIGLGVPRAPVRLVETGGRIELLQPDSGLDATAAMRDWAGGFLARVERPDGFLLKSRSPSCGPNDVKIYASAAKGAPARKGGGMFASLARETFPHAAMEHEGRVRNFHLREHFLSKLFVSAGFEQAVGQESRAALSDFHAANKLLFMAYDQARMRAMGRLAAGNLPLAEACALYRQHLDQALAKPPEPGNVVNTLDHAAGYFKKGLSGAEKAHFRSLVEEYRQGRAPLFTLQALLESWVARFEVSYLAGQSFFAPYPRELVDLADSGKGRDY